MSLLIWLPLHGNLNNYGSLPVTFSLNTSGGGVAAATSGGKTDLSCYQRTTINTASHITSSDTLNLSSNFTMACWCYPTTPGAQTSANGIITNHNHADNDNKGSGSGITLKYDDSDPKKCYISCNTSETSGRTFRTKCGTTNIYGAWHHLCLTYNKANKIARLYVDGICENEFTYDNVSGANKVNIFDWSTGHSTSGSYRPLCRINDVRVYDECLSKKEVKLLSQGLVAHYKLDGGGANNLLTNTSNPTSTSGMPYNGMSIVYDEDMGANVFQRSTSTTSESYLSSHRIPIEPSTKYTFSCDIKVNEFTKKVDFHWLADTAAENKTGTGYVNAVSANNKSFTPNVWHHFTWTFTSKADDRTGFIRIDNGGSTTTDQASIVRITNLKLEKGSKATGYGRAANEMNFSVADDCSGYNRNGTTSGTFTFDTDSPRYDTCAIFDGSTTKIHLPIKGLMTSLLKDKCTINFWVNEADISNRSIYFGGYSGSNFNIEESSGRIRVYWNATPDITVANSIEANTWIMFTVVTDVKTGIKIYKNGTLLYTHSGALTDITSGFTNETFRIGADSRSDSTMMEGKMSDFRIYCSALSADDIKTLYDTAGSVTKEGGLIAYEFQEQTDTSAKMKKTGTFVAGDFSERGKLVNMKFTTLPDGSSWARVFYHNNRGGTVLFTSVDEVQKSNTADKFSCLYLLDNLKNTSSKYEFMLTFPADAPGQYNRWRQNKNPCKEYVEETTEGTGTAAGYTAVHIDWGDRYWGGLTRQKSDASVLSNTYLSGSVGHGNWFYAVGASSAWNNGIPGHHGSIGVQETELWVRINTLSKNSRFNIMNEQFASGTLFQEI